MMRRRSARVVALDRAPSTKPSPPDEDLLNQGSGDARPPAADEDLDDLLNGGSGEDEPSPENDPPIERSDGQVYGG
jgi:hypothetical protein